QCVLLCWKHGNWRNGISCPVCRQQVSVLLCCFPDQHKRNESKEEIKQILTEINNYNRRFSGAPRPWSEYVSDLPVLLRHMLSEFFSVGSFMYMFRLRVVLCFMAAIMYLVSPLDMIPEALFGIFGLIDDLFIVFLLSVYITIIYRRFLATRWEDEISD
ncbi:E3 ubiquitin-protein ligase RNF170-like, partial [Limulus polyphemus]|uniref:E3 ubiquitin-protein ligase RNF170-like n=1 Tax=Limulus polyphemus TaxID=6850 RepID=A0ABM1BV70_LIMPO